MKPDLDLDSLIQRIREEAARPEYQTAGMPAPAAPAAEPFFSRPTPSTATSAPAGPAHRSAGHAMPVAASVDELLLAGSDEAFVDQAYRTLLHRAPDAAGRETKLALLRAGHRRPYVIHAMRTSDEGKRVGAELPGMGRLLGVYGTARKLGRGPLRPLARSMDRAYSAWRHVRIAVNGVGLRRLDSQVHAADQALASLDSAAHGWRGDIRDLRSDLEQVRSEAQMVRQELHGARDELQDIRDDVQAVRDSMQAQQNDLASLGIQVAEQGRRLDPLPQLGQGYRRELDLLRTRINMLHRRTLPVQASGEQAAGSPAAAPSRNDLAARIDAYYVSFEEVHRGSEDSIRAKLEGYIDQLTSLPEDATDKPVVDIGCGRGEWLRLLSENGFTGIGVDLNPDMVAHCREHGMVAHHADALAWLSAQADASCAAISAFHIVEHLPFDILFPLIEQAWRVLMPGGVLIIETPNPENVLVGSHTFYHDFSHRNPVTPTSLQFLVGYHGFAVSELLRLSPYPPEARVAENSLVADRVNGHFCGPQDYAVIAVKPASVTEPAGTADGRIATAEGALANTTDNGPENDATGATA